MVRQIPLSDKPANVRDRIRRRMGRGMEDMRTLASTRKPIEDWDVEELARGRPRCEDGSFRGPAPKWITPALIDEAKRRLTVNALGAMGAYVQDAVKVVHGLMMSTATDDRGKPIVDAKTRLAAAMFIIDHVVGKPTTRVQLDDPQGRLREMLAGALKMVDDDGQMIDAHPVVDLADDEWTDEEDG